MYVRLADPVLSKATDTSAATKDGSTCGSLSGLFQVTPRSREVATWISICLGAGLSIHAAIMRPDPRASTASDGSPAKREEAERAWLLGGSAASGTVASGVPPVRSA